MTIPAGAELESGPDAVQAARAEWRMRQILGAAAKLMVRDGFHRVSMQSIADEAEMSVGLIYRYFAGKQEILLGVIVDVLDSFADRIPRAMDDVGDDPIRRIAAGFRAYCEIIDENRAAALLTYRDGKTLEQSGREQIMTLEFKTSKPLRDAVETAVDQGLLTEVNVDLFTYDLMIFAQMWSLKYWHFKSRYTLDEYVTGQTALVLRSSLDPRRRRKYQDLLA
ncbi:TetR family transcriptional regulator [Antricoccus suffuscus]|uniref:TetR family transcriptional regulator n=1 Tax=Antricoccus suffuscus TaxID=1629062 RepID=A0A2T0YZH4_9ACTN|nr:TetR/AcrR family transcriptional regulator [Antricoccus suffuscus]PRZ29502.1 TetR family transcriptional regulator [Antricoccus suffuscus]